MQKPGFHLQSLQLPPVSLCPYFERISSPCLFVLFFFLHWNTVPYRRCYSGQNALTLPEQIKDQPHCMSGWLLAPGTSLRACVCVCGVCVLSHAWLFATPWTVAHLSPLSMGFSRQEYWSGGCHFFFHRIFPTQGSNLCLFRLLLCRQILYHRAIREEGDSGQTKGPRTWSFTQISLIPEFLSGTTALRQTFLLLYLSYFKSNIIC